MSIKLEDWSVTSYGSIYTPPENHAKLLQGTVYGHPGHDDGKKITSSPILFVKGRKVTTRSGSEYVLGKPDPKWIVWMRANNIPFNPDQPIKIIK
jgi:hypothetical protein